MPSPSQRRAAAHRARRKDPAYQARRTSPLYQAMRDLAGRDELGSNVASALFDAGVDTPEKIKSMTYAELIQITGAGRRATRRLVEIKSRLN